MLLGGQLAIRKQDDFHRPSEAIEAPERRKSSEPIWMEKTFSEGKLQDPLLGRCCEKSESAILADSEVKR